MSQFPGTNNNLVVTGAICLALAELTGCSRETTTSPLANKPDAIGVASLIQNQDALLNQEVTCRGFAIYNGCEGVTPRMPGQPEWTNLWALMPTTELPTSGPSTFYRPETFVGMRSDVLSKEQNTREIALGGGRVPQEVMVTGVLVEESDGYRYFKASNIESVNSDANSSGTAGFQPANKISSPLHFTLSSLPRCHFLQARCLRSQAPQLEEVLGPQASSLQTKFRVPCILLCLRCLGATSCRQDACAPRLYSRRCWDRRLPACKRNSTPVRVGVCRN